MQKAVLFNGFISFLLAAGTAAASFFGLSAQGTFETDGWVLDGDMVMDETLHIETLSTARLNGRDSVTLLPGAEARVRFDETEKKVTVDLDSGTLIFSTLADDFSVTAVTPFARVDSQHSTAVVTVEEGTQDLNVLAITHPSLVTFVANGEDLNALPIPSAHRMKVSSAKVTEVLARLRLTKLSKEFPVFSLADGDLTEEMTQVLGAIQSAYDAQSIAFLEDLQDRSDFGPPTRGVGALLHGAYRSFREALTVLPTAETHLNELQQSDALTFAFTHYLYGDALVADGWLAQWSASHPDLQEVEPLYSSMFFVLPGDELYPLKSALATLLYEEENPLDSLYRQFGQIESLLDRASPVEAGQAYSEYKTQFQTALDSGAFDSEDALLDISREYYLLELMLRSNAVFYDTDLLTLLKTLEERILLLAGSDQDLDEERQAFVQSKLRFLTKLFGFVEEKKLNLVAASDLASELIFEANAYLNSLTKSVAVTEYFKGQLELAELSVAFMNTPEFYTYDSFADGLEAYKAKQADLLELNAYIQSIRSGGEELADATEAEALVQAEQDLFSHGIQYSSLLPQGDSAHRLFELQGARAAGYAFQAKYDRATQILYDVVVGTVRFSTGLRVQDASKVIAQAMASQVELEENDVSVDSSVNLDSETSLTESVALQLVNTQLRAAGLEPDDFIFTVLDVQENAFIFEGTISSASIPVSGAYDADTQKITEIVWQLGGSVQTLPDTDLAHFEAAVYETYVALSSVQ